MSSNINGGKHERIGLVEELKRGTFHRMIVSRSILWFVCHCRISLSHMRLSSLRSGVTSYGALQIGTLTKR